MPNNQKFLFDALQRNQVFLEELKEDRYLHHIDPTLRKIARVLRKHLNELSEDAFETMTRGQYRKLVAEIVEDLTEELVSFRSVEEAFFEEFTEAANLMQKEILEATFEKPVPQVATRARTQNELISALGVRGKDVTSKYIDDTIDGIKDVLLKSYIDKEKITDTKTALLGTKSQNYRNGFMMKSKRWYGANTSSHIQAIATETNQAYSEQAVKRGDMQNFYIWKSVLDNRTSKICRSRSNNIYENGNGPLPPAHPNCRSNVIPLLVGIKAATVKNFPSNWLSWISDQPEPVLEKILGIDYTAKLQDQRAIAKFNPLGTVNIKQYRDLTSTITYAGGISSD